jgi:aconitate hydratase
MMMPESSGITLLGDLAAMRDAVQARGGDPRRVNPQVPVDFIVDHSVTVDAHARPDALAHNMRLEFAQNRERYEFLRWGAQAFDRLRVFPPGSGILHQINLEYLARVVWTEGDGGGRLAYPDSLIAMDSHTAMVNALGVVGWGVGGLEGGSVALGEPISMLLPDVVGCHFTGRLQPGVTATDLALTLAQFLRRHQIIGKFVEFVGPGVDELSLPERATVSNMTPEYGATMSYFPVDGETLRYMRITGRDERQLELVEAYARVQGLWRDATGPLPAYRTLLEFDLRTVEPSVSGPGRPDARVALAEAPAAFRAAYPRTRSVPAGTDSGHALADGDVVIAAITSCTNTANPQVMIGAGLLARNARRRGLKPRPWVKTSLSPGSRVVADYLAASGLQEDLDAFGFHVTGFGCMSCMGNSGSLPEAVARAIAEHDIAAVAVLSGNRNFDARIHSAVRANFLASPPLVVAYALMGTVARDLGTEPLGVDSAGRSVRLADIWPEREEILALTNRFLTADIHRSRYAGILCGPPQWQQIGAPQGSFYRWDAGSHFLVRPPYFDDMPAAPAPQKDIRGARVLALLGDMVTTDHISPIGSIPADGPAGRYLQSLGVAPRDFVNYAARRLNHHVMVRGTFANVRLQNEMTPGVEGTSTRYWPGGQAMTIFEAAERYRDDGVPLIVVAGREYGAGSSRDWAAKGTRLLGILAVIAESFERIHRANLVSMGVLPLQLPEGTTRHTLRLDGSERIDIEGLESRLVPKIVLRGIVTRTDGARFAVALTARLDTTLEVEYYRHGGIIAHVLRKHLAADGAAPAL